ncbi:unnamed protein product [Urochloa decumbens]|uniref:F-box domain-containing protein n=1 Tax=Urochloa decumbens TaxID=240449 RepID=A0ABC8WDK7_9POAL
MDGVGEDNLSTLSDDLLRRILHFVPFKEAASTSVLSRRWRSLWRSSGAVNLDVRIRQGRLGGSHRDACFVRAAEAALAAAESPVTRFTLRVDTDGDESVIEQFLHSGCPGVATALFSHPVALCAEEFRIAAGSPSRREVLCYPEVPESEIKQPVGVYYCFGFLPSSKTLRVLDITNFRDFFTFTLPSTPAAFFPRLATLRLSMCSVHTWELQALFDAAPELATVHLESVFFRVCPLVRAPRTYYVPQPPGMRMPLLFPPGMPPPPNFNALIRLFPPAPQLLPQVRPLLPPPFFHYQPPPPPPQGSQAAQVHLRCPAATDLVLELCGFETQQSDSDGWAMEIDAPRLRSFRYKGLARRFLLTSPAPDMARVDLHFLDDASKLFLRFDPKCKDEYKHKMQALFWKFVQNFACARDLKLKVPYLKDIAAVGKARQAELLCAFPNVVRLELEGAHRLKSTTTAVAIANLLHCCPIVRDLRLNLRSVPSDSNMYSGRHQHQRPAPDNSRSWDDYSKSVGRFMRLSSKPATFKEDDSGEGKYGEVPAADIPELSGCSFACLQSSLRRVSLQFRLDTPSCLGVRLLKFFADNAMVLEEMHVDTGNRRLHEHMNLSLERWIIAPDGSSGACLKRKNLTDSSWEFSKFPRLSKDSITTDLTRSTTGSFTVLPLQR